MPPCCTPCGAKVRPGRPPAYACAVRRSAEFFERCPDDLTADAARLLAEVGYGAVVGVLAYWETDPILTLALGEDGPVAVVVAHDRTVV
jgi:hypothetical protein